ncbi:hypothetical protein HYH03_010536 [Edaphochlamys debaryana]|uniref:Protein kinase domain-containing protein n=1 Tax=Edaphochlamys debaryana TaxID=47281 RepID=A0A835XWU2_9CHLO|nr:hypothetical protein HYH03_010536 [Edaphochlamys debaryana]|eukprot:KAG2491092.1 hypothetical protein HYH03_010536 [Edaphochlamys debaryana]
MAGSMLILEDMVIAYDAPDGGQLAPQPQASATWGWARGLQFGLLTRSPEGTRGAVVLARHIAGIISVCLPLKAFAQSFGGGARPPELPGQQVVSASAGSWDFIDGCTNDTSAPPAQRCWAAAYAVEDMAKPAADLDEAFNPTPTHYNMAMQNSVVLCARVLDQACVDSLGPLGCIMAAREEREGQVLSAAPELFDAAGDASGGGMGPGRRRAEGPVLAGCVVGGTVGLLAAAAVALLAVRAARRRKNRSQLEAAMPGMGDNSNDSVAGAAMLQVALAVRAGCCGGALTKPCGSDPAESAAPKDARGGLSPGDPLSPEGSGSGPGPRPHSASGPYPPQPPRRPVPAGNAAANEAAVLSAQTPLHDLSVHLQVLKDFATGGAAPPGEALGAPVPLPPDNVVRLTGRVLGRGAYARVEEGTYRGQCVAVKQLLDCCWEEAADRYGSYLQELEVLGRCDHPNIVRVLAASVQHGLPPVLVLELMETSLDKVLYGTPGSLLPMRLVLHVAAEVARGLSYLHPTVVHRDVKPANVLISDPHGDRPVVKLSDFGLARLRETALVTTQPAGTMPYVAPECFDVTCYALTHRMDCYSFGVMLWECLAGARPWDGVNGMQVAFRVSMLSHRLPLPAHGSPGGGDQRRWPPRLVALLRQCWEAEPLRRPAAADIVKVLALAQEDERRGRS